jgi:hypothetical protein
MKLLVTNNGNTKIRKSAEQSGFRIASLSLWPDLKICPGSKAANCMDPCLKSEGRGKMNSVMNARMTKTQLWHEDRERFLEMLFEEIFVWVRRCKKSGHQAAIRLNTISDIAWEQYGIFEEFPDLFGYDYTKRVQRLGRTPDNYKLIFSYSAEPAYQGSVAQALKTDHPLAVVFRGGLPNTYLGRQVIDGDKSDIINVNAGPVVIGLRAKGTSGKRSLASGSKFIVDNPELIEVAA